MGVFLCVRSYCLFKAQVCLLRHLLIVTVILTNHIFSLWSVWAADRFCYGLSSHWNICVIVMSYCLNCLLLQIKGSSFSWTFFGSGYSQKLEDPESQHEEAPDEKIVTKVSGPGMTENCCCYQSWSEMALFVCFLVIFKHMHVHELYHFIIIAVTRIFFMNKDTLL